METFQKLTLAAWGFGKYSLQDLDIELEYKPSFRAIFDSYLTRCELLDDTLKIKKYYEHESFLRSTR